MIRERLQIWLKYLLFFWGVGGINAMYAQSSPSDNAIIFCGKILNADSNQIITLRFYKDFLTFDELTYSDTIKNDSFYLKIPFRENVPGFIVYKNENLPIFVEKGDSIHLKTYAKTFIDSINYSGQGGLTNTYLQQTFLEFDVGDAKKVEDGIAKNTAEGFKQLLATYKQEKVNFLDTFIIQRDTQFTKAFDEYVRADINYWWGQNLMRYRIEHPASAVLPVALNLPTEYFQFIDTLALNNEKALNNVNYLFYLEQYSKWREERISKGKLQFKNTVAIKKELIKVKMVETFGQVLIDQLEVRKEAYDGLSAFAKLDRGAEVLYLQDITTDRFMYPYKGKRYRDKFLKIELPDGRSGWVFSGGINLKQKIVYAKKWVEIPDTRPELMRSFKYANFKGKVMQYAVAKDVYWELLQKGQKDHRLLQDYLEKAEDNAYTRIIASAYAAIEKDTAQLDTLRTKLPVPQIEKNAADSAQAISGVIKNITATTAKNLIDKKKAEIPESKHELVVASEDFVITPPDFSLYNRVTSIDGRVGRATLSQPTFVINTNPLLREETNFPFPSRTETNFHYDVSLKSSTTATIKLGDKAIDLYLQPGYDLKMEINGNDLYQHLTFSGKGSEINNYFVALAAAFKHTALELETNIRYAEPPAFKAFMEQLRNEKLKFLRNYLQSHTLTAEVIKYARAEINYWYAFNLMNYPYEHPIFHNQVAPMPVPEDYYDFMDKISINNAGALPNKYYVYYLQDYLSFKANQSDNKGKTRYELADKYLKGKPLYFYKALQHSIEIKRGKHPDSERNAYLFIENSPYKLYGEFVKLAYHESRGIVEGMDAPNFVLADVDGNMVSLADYKGKVVFLDFWATWCRPCTRLLPTHKKLQAQFANDNVAFLYVSLDKNANNWRRYLEKGLFPGKHLFANETMSKKYKVETLPYSVLIDADGKIVWQHTGGFSVQRTAQRILELLQ